VQEFLQRHYINAIQQVALQLKHLPNVVGYDVLNEPSSGFIGRADLYSSAGGLLRMGESPSPFQAMLLGAGFPQEVEIWEIRITGPKLRDRRLLNPDGVRVWVDRKHPRGEHTGIWRENGVWDVGPDGTPRLLRPHHFARVDNRIVDFANDYLRPFANRYARAIRSIAPDAIIFVEGEPGMTHPGWGPKDEPSIVHAAHWYDGMTLLTKNFIPFLSVDTSTGKLVLGRKRVRHSFAKQLAHIKRWAVEGMNGVPTLIGEVGIPFDMKDKKSYRTGDFSLQVKALDASIQALEANLLSFTLWNYTADNTNQRGDQWNDEDLSIFSRDQQSDPDDINSGGRALEAAVRPYAHKIAGEPLRMAFDIGKRTFEFEFRHDPHVDASTEIFVPNFQYPDGYAVEVSDGTYTVDRENQTLLYQHSAERKVHHVRLRRSRK
jgi:hypothetical protein